MAINLKIKDLLVSGPDAVLPSYERLVGTKVNKLQVLVRSEIIIIDECIFLTHFL